MLKNALPLFLLAAFTIICFQEMQAADQPKQQIKDEKEWTRAAFYQFDTIPLYVAQSRSIAKHDSQNISSDLARRTSDRSSGMENNQGSSMSDRVGTGYRASLGKELTLNGIQITSIMQDQDGKLWFETPQGMSRVDRKADEGKGGIIHLPAGKEQDLLPVVWILTDH